MKFHYGWRILAGLIIFLGIIATPFLLGAANKAYETPEDKLPTKELMKELGYDDYSCIESKEFMRNSHMTLLDQWRDDALRDGKRFYAAHDGKQYMISLQNTCMKCHVSKAEFCDKCHEAAAVTPYCWDCHYSPEELKNEAQ